MRDHVKSVRLRLGRNVQHFRRLRALSQEALAELAGSSLKQIGRVERGEVNVTVDVLIRIAVSLRVNISDLFDLDSERPDFALISAPDLEVMATIIDRVKAGRPRPRRQRSR